MKLSEFTVLLKERALYLGFDACGIAAAGSLSYEGAYLQEWLSAGKQAGMDYMTRNVEKRTDVRLLVENACSVVMLLMCYKPSILQAASLPQVAYYAYGKDYHEVIRPMLKTLAATIKEYYPDTRVRGFVDSAPLFEKAWAARAGLGWIGKNNLLVSPVFGSFVFLAALVTDLELSYDTPSDNRCGKCLCCIRACPVGALEAPFCLNAQKCIAYQTIESRDKLAGYTYGYLFGCDLCQLQCPWNRTATPHTHAAFNPLPEILSYTTGDWLALDETQFNTIFAHSPLQRCGLKKIQEIIQAM